MESSELTDIMHEMQCAFKHLEQQMQRLQQYLADTKTQLRAMKQQVAQMDRRTERATRRAAQPPTRPALSPIRAQVLTLLLEQPGLRTREIAAQMDKPRRSIARLLSNMCAAKQLENQAGDYYLAAAGLAALADSADQVGAERNFA